MTTPCSLSFLPDYYGHGNTIKSNELLYIDGSPIPWMTYPAIAYLNQLDFSKKQVFEYGSGSSTIYWSRRCKNVISVENDSDWYSKISAMNIDNAEIFFLQGTDYVNKIQYHSPHDVIVIDGRWRYDCGMHCLKFLRDGGMVILDNSERHPPIAKFFRDNGLIEVDMIGYGPINRYCWSTSIFFTQKFNIQGRDDMQPRYSPGMVDSMEQNPTLINANRPNAMD